MTGPPGPGREPPSLRAEHTSYAVITAGVAATTLLIAGFLGHVMHWVAGVGFAWVVLMVAWLHQGNNLAHLRDIARSRAEFHDAQEGPAQVGPYSTE